MTETNFQKLTRAIKEKKQISFEYHHPDKPLKWGKRIGNPHIIYIQHDTHNRTDIFQIVGIGSNEPILKQYLLEYLENIVISENTFIIEQFNSNAPRYVKKLVDVNEYGN